MGILIIEKNNFASKKVLIFLKDVDIENVLVSNKISGGEKKWIFYWFGYLYNDYQFKPLHLMLPKARGYVKICDRQTKYVYFLIEHDELLEKYNSILDKVSADIKKEFDSKPVHNK